MEGWDYAGSHVEALENRRAQPGGRPGDDPAHSPLYRELLDIHGKKVADELYAKEDTSRWPPWGCRMHGYIEKEKRTGKLADRAEEGI